MTDPSDPLSPASRLAGVLRRHKEQLLRDWTQRVIADPTVPEANRLTEPELRDHVPDLIDTMIRDLEVLGTDGGAGRVLRADAPARRHARDRAARGYPLDQALRELAHFREALLDLCAMSGATAADGSVRRLNAAIDESMRIGAYEIERTATEAVRRQADLFDQSHDAILFFRLGGKGIITWNRSAETLYGWLASEAIGRVSHDLLHTEWPGGSMDEVERTLQREGLWEGQLGHTTRDGRKITVLARLAVVQRDADGVLVMETNRDITEIKELLESERAARSEAERAAHLRDEFVATVSHELRTPLNAILGWAAMLRSGKLDGAASARALEVVERNARAQAELVEDLLDISRIGSGKLQLEVRQVDLAAVVENAVASHVPAACAKGVTLTCTADGRSCTVLGDPGRLEQIVSNLLSNAIKFTPKGGSVTVQVGLRGAQVELVVEDSGRGITPDFMEHVFDRFRQAEATLTRQHRGLGLGLALVKYLVEQHGGAVGVESEGEGRGAKFTVTLAHTSEAAALSTVEACASLDGVKALVVDDQEDSRVLVSRILADCAAEVATVASVAEALELLPQLHPDVLISDIGMPELDGYHLIRAVRALDANHGGSTPAVALTAFARPEDRLRALRAGYQMHVAKPVDASELILVIANLTGRVGGPKPAVSARG